MQTQASIDEFRRTLWEDAQYDRAERTTMPIPSYTELSQHALALALGYVGEDRQNDLPQIAKFLLAEYDSQDEDPFCAAFASFCHLKAYAELMFVPFTADNVVAVFETLRPIIAEHYLICSASCGALMRDAEARERWRAFGSGYAPQPGDLVLFCWNGTGQPEHVGRVIEMDGETVKTIEGNTSDASNANGGAIAIKEREINSCVVGWIKLQD